MAQQLQQQSDPKVTSPQTAEDNQDLQLPHALECLATSRAMMIEIEALSLQLKKLLLSREGNPLNIAVAEALAEQIHRRSGEMLEVMEIQ